MSYRLLVSRINTYCYERDAEDILRRTSRRALLCAIRGTR